MAKINNILLQDSKTTINSFLETINEISDIDNVKFRDLVLKNMKYLRGKKEMRENLREEQELENNWYKSIENGSPDYDIYNHPSYLAELMACWLIYSKEYIKNLLKLGLFPTKAEKIVDLGCGFGFTTIALKEIYPNAKVIGTNIKDTDQFLICEYITKQHEIEIIDNFADAGKVDMVFASEYFEHIYNPIDHLFYIIGHLQPRYMFCANSFNSKAVGHFPFYLVADELIENRKLGRIFNAEMRLHGYEKEETKLWNDRPTCWKHFYES